MLPKYPTIGSFFGVPAEEVGGSFDVDLSKKNKAMTDKQCRGRGYVQEHGVSRASGENPSSSLDITSHPNYGLLTGFIEPKNLMSFWW